MWIGESRNCKCPIKCLGIYITYDYDEFIKLNYKQRLKKMEKIIIIIISFTLNLFRFGQTLETPFRMKMEKHLLYGITKISG